MGPRRKKSRSIAESDAEGRGMTARQLAARCGVSVRAVRFYVAERVLPAPKFRGRATRYGQEHLLRLAALRCLQRDKRLSLPIIRRHLEQVDRAELERLAVAFMPELAPAPLPTAEPAAEASTTQAPPVGNVHDSWQRILLLPGLELHLHCAASSDVRSLAREIIDRLSGAVLQS